MPTTTWPKATLDEAITAGVRAPHTLSAESPDGARRLYWALCRRRAATQASVRLRIEGKGVVLSPVTPPETLTITTGGGDAPR